MQKKIITISRQFACGGREIGKMVADKLGIDFYDKELLAIVAKKSGYAVEFLEETGEFVNTSLLFNVATGSMMGHRQFIHSSDMPIADKVYVAQHNIIKELAEKGPCVIIGRGADYILKDRDDCFNVFIHADMDFRKERAVKVHNMSEKNLEKEILKRDKRRANHYNHYSDGDWGAVQNYHITLNSSVIGFEKCADIICDLVQNT